MRTLLVEGDKTFKIDIPVDAKVTFGPWSPPKGKDSEYRTDPEARKGTLRIYTADGKNVLAVFAHVRSFRDLAQINYSEQVAKEEGAAIWKSDQDGYHREENISRKKEWVDPVALPEHRKTKKK